MTSSSSIAVSVGGLALAYGETRILKGVDFVLPRGSVLALLGPSGCGKTTLLRLVAGLLAPSEGRIEILGRKAADAAEGFSLPPEARGLGMVFQDYALWPHLSVAGNVAFPLEMRGIPKAERRARVEAALERVGLAALAERRPSELSGGQQQRVAIARAVAAEPPLILFDEPLSNLDRELRESMVEEIGALIAQLGLTAIYVTHDQSEAFALADQVAVMRAGSIEQLAPPEELVRRPATPEVAEFLRLGCVAPAERCPAGGWRIDGTDMFFAASDAHDAEAAEVLLPSRALKIGESRPERLRAEVLASRFQGQAYSARLRLLGTPHEIRLRSPVRLSPGEILGLSADPDELRWFPRRAS